MPRKIKVTLTFSDDWEDFDHLDSEELMEEVISGPSDPETIEVEIESDERN
jgi:hypothetical protein